MTCADFETLLDRQFGPAFPSNDPALFEHVAACDHCRASWDRHRLLADAISAWREQAPEVDLTSAVIARLKLASQGVVSHIASGGSGSRRQPVGQAFQPDGDAVPTLPGPPEADGSADVAFPARSSRMRSRQNAGLGRSRRSLVAAAFALIWLVVLAALRNSSPSVQSVFQNSASNAGKVTKPSDDTVPGRPDLLIARADKVVADDSATYAGLVQLATGAWDEVSLLVRPERKTALQPESPPQSAALEGWIDGLQHQLRPIGRGLDNAFDFLWQAGQAGDG